MYGAKTLKEHRLSCADKIRRQNLDGSPHFELVCLSAYYLRKV